MKVILLQDVAKIGRRFDIVEVPSGYGMNKLIPQGMAKPATPENVKAINAQSAKTEADRAAGDAALQTRQSMELHWEGITPLLKTLSLENIPILKSTFCLACVTIAREEKMMCRHALRSVLKQKAGKG